MTAVLDEIGELVEKHTIRDCPAKLGELKLSLLGCERSPEIEDITAYDPELLAEYPGIDLPAVMAMRHTQKILGVALPRFAMFAHYSNICNLRLFEADGKLAANSRVLDKYVESVGPEVVAYGNRRIWLWQAASTTIAALLFGSVASAAYLAGASPLMFLCTLLAIPSGWAMTGLSTNYDAIPTVSATARFAGLIPSDVRQRIIESLPKFEQVYLVQEVVEWNAEVIRPADPLVVGEKDGVYYLIDRFDTTTLEEYVPREFSV